MRIALKSSLLLFAALPLAAAAQGFLPYCGVSGNSHFAREPAAAGFSATGDAVLSHGSLPAISTYTAGIKTVTAYEAGVIVTLASDGGSLFVNGVENGCGYGVFAVDGRMMADGKVADGVVSLRGLGAGQYLLRLCPAGTAPCVYNFIKKN